MSATIKYAVVAIFIGLAGCVVFGEEQIRDPACPGGKYSCQAGQTCCRAGGGQFACCPYDNAVCCSDLQSCCPNGYQCNVTGQTCYKVRRNRPTIPFSLLEPSVTYESTQNATTGVEGVGGIPSGLGMVGKKACPDGKQMCPDSYTCCAQATGGYGCCPLTGGVCCEDKVHCCPMGTTCNTKLGSCDS